MVLHREVVRADRHPTIDTDQIAVLVEVQEYTITIRVIVLTHRLVSDRRAESGRVAGSRCRRRVLVRVYDLLDGLESR